MYETIKGEGLKAYGDAGNINAYYLLTGTSLE